MVFVSIKQDSVGKGVIIVSCPWWSLFLFYFGLFSLFSLIAYKTLLQTGAIPSLCANNSFRVRYEAVYPNNIYIS